MDKYLELAYKKLGRFLRDKELKDVLRQDINGLVYLLLRVKEMGMLDRVIILVFDGDEIVADVSSWYCGLNDFVFNPEVLDVLSNESDWSFLEHYCLCAYYFSDLGYPVGEERISLGDGVVFGINSIYVTKAYRRNGVFLEMMEFLEDFGGEDRELYFVVSLDPDVACYGPDRSSVPYVYSMAIDEPKRLLNKEILEGLGFVCFRLEDSDESSLVDGSKLWFGVRRVVVHDLSMG